MPLNPTENIPASFRKRNPFVNNFFENLKELKINEQLKGGKTDEYIKAALSLNQNNNGRLYVSPSSDDVEEFLKCKEVSGSFSLRTMLAMGKHSVCYLVYSLFLSDAFLFFFFF